MVKAALRRLLRTPGLGDDVVRRMRFRYRAFDGVASTEYAPGAVPELEFNRLNEHWEAAGRLARLILDQESLRDEAGEILGISFTVDMNKLFERFVEKIVGEEVRDSPWQLVPQAPCHLAVGVPMAPDLLLRGERRGRRRCEVQGVGHLGTAQRRPLPDARLLRVPGAAGRPAHLRGGTTPEGTVPR
jgi:5-methylcytosine-specific restriction endonuclease McrBC regulatory subunit McrC